MKNIYLLILLISIQSCARIVPLEGKYQEVPVKSLFDASFEKTWEAVIDFISDTGQEVQLIDKASGLIISDMQGSSGMSLSNEDKKGVLINKNAVIAVDRLSSDYPKTNLTAHIATSTWTIRIKELKNKSLEVSTLVHVKRVERIVGKYVFKYNGKSTGNFERYLLDEISANIKKEQN